ncbi:prion-inhibition and propagation-domain-containing protein [Annulohypoxylon bovei var. microspora]|nr:prion-inhibition and propagation-domain-containing protein [Annulohypoxylon bovei var. microspora]
MDPGTALGVISLSFQVFAGCIKGCQLLLEAKHFPQKYSYLRHRLRLEQLKLLDWWDASGFTAEAAFQDTQLDERKQAMVDSLIQIRSITLDISRIKERYDLTLKIADDDQRDDTTTRGGLLVANSTYVSISQETLRQKSLNYADAVLKCPTRLRWALFDAAKFKQLLARFAELNNSMHSSLELEQRRRHAKLQEATQIQILQVHDKLDQVVELIQSLRLAPNYDPGGPWLDSDESEPSTLESLARFKVLSMTANHEDFPCEREMIVQIGLEIPSPADLELLLSQVELQDDQRQLGAQRIAGMYGSAAVWTEWKCYDERSTTLAYHCVESRITRLAALLHKNAAKPRELRLPVALGYVHDRDLARFGLVFELPALTSMSVPQSLYDRLQTSMKPSLSMRLNMARKLVVSLEYLHATKWLHKGLRSDNILFLTSYNPGWLSFCLSGFDYSRPAVPNEVTEVPSSNREHDLYRHPDVQFDVPRDGEYGYREKHDVYSLGVVLMEIGLWQPIHQFLGISLNRLISRPVIRGVRSSLLKANSLALLTSEAGALFSEAVRLCLSCDQGYLPDGSKVSAMLRKNGISSLHKAQEILQSINL